MSGSGLPEGISLVDPRPIARENPYTFFLPHPEHIEAMREGDLVKATFVDRDGSHDAERMWVRIERVLPEHFVGTLANEPFDMQNLEHGDPVAVDKTCVIATLTGDSRPLPAVDEPQEYWDRCLVDACVLQGRSHADYLYREPPDMGREEDEYPDSGWRIRGTDAAIAEDVERDEPPQYVALGAVLNRDDRWLHLIDEQPGVGFQWDSEALDYSRIERPELLEGE